MKVVFAGSFAVRLVAPVQARLTLPCEVIADTETRILPHLADADVFVSMCFTKEMAAAAPRLRLVQVPGAGLDRIEPMAVPPGVHLANAYGHEGGIAEYVIGAMIALTRDFHALDTKLRASIWHSQWAVDASPPPLWPELAGKTLGILGFGHIGQAIAQRARAFGMRICAIRREAEARPPQGVWFIGGLGQLDDVLRQSDFIVVTLSLSEQTCGLLDARRLGLMSPSAHLINVARAEIVDEKALYEALAKGRIAGAALDVWYRYPTAPGPAMPATVPFHELPNVIMTPHISGWTEGMLRARAELIAENIERAARGAPPLNAVASIA